MKFGRQTTLRDQAVLNPTGMVFKFYRDRFGTIPVNVSGNSVLLANCVAEKLFRHQLDPVVFHVFSSLRLQSTDLWIWWII